jgi:AcrR family transcriptional regulator
MNQKSGYPNNHKSELTRDRILDKAEVLFANRGYHAVSVRAITTAAACNLAAVNYHFGNKQNLYLEVFRSRWLPRAKRVHRTFKKSLGNNGSSSPRAVVHSLVAAFLGGSMSDEERTRHHKLIYGELAQPTAAFELVNGQVLQPLFDNLLSDLRAAMPSEIDEQQMALDVFSILAMVLYFSFARPVVDGFLEGNGEGDIEEYLVDHIVRFALNGISADKEEGRK